MGCLCEIYIVVQITMHDRCRTLPSGRFVLYILAASHRQNTQSYTCFIRCSHIYKKKKYTTMKYTLTSNWPSI